MPLPLNPQEWNEIQRRIVLNLMTLVAEHKLLALTNPGQKSLVFSKSLEWDEIQ